MWKLMDDNCVLEPLTIHVLPTCSMNPETAALVIKYFLQCLLVCCMYVHMYTCFLCMYMVGSVTQQTYHPRKRCISSVPLCSTSYPSQCSCYGCWSSPQTSSPCTTSTQWSDHSGHWLSGDCGSHSMSPRADSLGCENTKRRACDTIQGLLPSKGCSWIKEILVNKNSGP